MAVTVVMTNRPQTFCLEDQSTSERTGLNNSHCNMQFTASCVLCSIIGVNRQRLGISLEA